MHSLLHLLISSSFLFGGLLAQTCTYGPNRTEFTPVLTNDHVYIVGGTMDSADVYSLDLSNGLDINCPYWAKRDKVQINSQFGPFMYGVAYPASSGGTSETLYVQAGDGGTDAMTKLVQYNVSGSWRAPPLSGGSPTARAAMSATINSTGTAFYYGGRARQGSDTQYFDDFFTFDTNTASWGWPEITYGWGKAPKRYGHSATLVGDKLFVFGGAVALDSSAKMYADFQSVLVFDTVENTALSMATIGDIPPARFGFSATPAPDGKSIVVFGGLNTSASGFDSSQDVFVLDTCTLSWSKPEVSGDAPVARAGHGAITYGQYMLVMLGYSGILQYQDQKRPDLTNSVGILDMKSWKWVDRISHQDEPSRYDNAGCSFSFPNFPSDTNVYGGDHPLPYDPTVISNPNKPSNGARNKGLAIGFSLLGALLIVFGVWWYMRRQRRKARALNPRWLPGAVTSQQNNNDYPLFVYQDMEGMAASDEKIKRYGEGMRTSTSNTYTASDHAQWQRSLDIDSEQPEDGHAMSRHMDVWERMRDLHGQHSEQVQQQRKADNTPSFSLI